MEKTELMGMLSEGLSTEEIATLSNLEELRELVTSSKMDNSAKEKLMENIKHLIRRTLEHAKVFSELLREAQE